MSLSSQIRFSDFLTAADLIVFFGVLLLTLAAARWGESIKKKAADPGALSPLEYLVMGRRLTLPLFTVTLVATWYGGIFGVTEIAFGSGVYNFLTQGVFWYAAYLLFAFLLVRRVRSFGALTLPELAGKMFGPRSQKIAAAFNFFNILPVAYVISIGLFIRMIFGGTLLYATAIGTFATALFALWGGLRSVVFSDVVQFTVMCLSVLLVVLFCAAGLGGWEYLHSRLPATHFDATGGHSWAETLVWGFIALETLVDPSFYQRCFAAQDGRTARNGVLLATLVWCGFDLCTTLGGMYARAALPDADPRQAYPVLAMQVLPPGLRGFFLAGVLATILSTLDAFLLIASNTLSYDLAPRRWRDRAWFAHASTFAAAAVAIGLSLCFDGSVEKSWKILGSYAAGCLLPPMAFGFFRPGFLSDRGFVCGTLAGAAAITTWRLSERPGFWAEVDDLYAGLAATLAAMLLVKLSEVGASRFGRAGPVAAKAD